MQNQREAQKAAEELHDLLLLGHVARTGDRLAYGRLKDPGILDRLRREERSKAQSADRQRQAQHAGALFRRRVKDIEYQLGYLRKAIETTDEAAQLKALTEIDAIFSKMTGDEERQALETLKEINWGGNLLFLADHYSAK